MSHAIRTERLVKRYGNVTALDGVDLEVRRGAILGLLGPNGAGKTTIVRILATLIRPDGGYAEVAGYDVCKQAHQVRQLVGLTGQYASVDEKLTGRENLLLFARLLGYSHGAARRRAADLLAEFRLEEAANRAVGLYSGGMRRRLDLAASLVSRPAILFLDEPTTGLDPRARLELWSLIRELVGQGTTVLLTTQYLEEADTLADDVMVIDRGRVIAAGTPSELKARVGARALVVRAAREADVAPIAAAMHEVTGVAPEVGGLRLSVPMSASDQLPALVRRLDSAGIVVEELMLRSASLDDVFLAITGQRREHEEEREA
ncbi:ATP-binding cassette domain-containing protein [Ectothiorhodospiraceae bacterium 2226]|nr:ATP-binding cassette domain-containing protein [Ectothiorhodospiraceae bacterium 2226]